MFGVKVWIMRVKQSGRVIGPDPVKLQPFEPYSQRREVVEGRAYCLDELDKGGPIIYLRALEAIAGGDNLKGFALREIAQAAIERAKT